MHPESEAIILRKADYANHFTAMIADMVGNRTTIIDIHHSTNTNKDLPMLGPFFLYVTQELQTYLGLQTIYPSYWMIPSFWWYKLRDTWVGNIIRRIVNKIRNMKK